MQKIIHVGDRCRFDHKKTSWLARAETPDGRYTLCTAAMFGNVYYSIIDWQRDMRGPMNVIGWGLGISTTKGDDEGIDKAIGMLGPRLPNGSTNAAGLSSRGFTLSRRGEVPLRISDVRSTVVTLTERTDQK